MAKQSKVVEPGAELETPPEPGISVVEIKERLMKEKQLSTKSNIQFFFEKEEQNKKQSTKEYLSKLLQFQSYAPAQYENVLNPTN